MHESSSSGIPTGRTPTRYYDGFTTALPPNSKVLVDRSTDVDMSTEDENNGGPTYAAVTAAATIPAA